MLKLLFSFILLPALTLAHPMSTLEKAYLEKGENYQPRTQHVDKSGRAKFVNHLILEASPYLLQHAHNPVNWYSFSDEAFEKAKVENKPIFISIGYATCHWCHVMEEESFDDIDVATFINQHFIAIKVDREVRPDVDATYMSVAQLINGSGGWPLNAIILPNGKAFFAGTYFPKKQLLDILSKVHNLWQTDNQALIKQAGDIDAALGQNNTDKKGSIDKDIANRALQDMLSNFDELEGGFGEAPKFPNESMLLLLIDAQKRMPNDAQLSAITTTLDTMASGGFYDVVGGGFHRYSTDNAWLVPHFEKMLYNQAQLALVYTRAYQLTNKSLYRRIAEQTLDYTLGEMRNAEGGFFSATDADSQGEEGTFFVWSIKQLKTIFNQGEFAQFEKWFDLSSYSDFEGNHVIRFKDITQLKTSDYPHLDALLNKLYQLRIKRPAPLLDNKILLSWNALMVPTLFEAGAAFNNNKYTNAGKQLVKYLQTFEKEGVMRRVRIDDKLQTPALFEDYAYLASAYLAVFDHTGQRIWLDKTKQLVDDMNAQFWDKDNTGFNISSNNKYINTRAKEVYDGALPAPNAVAYQVLNKLDDRTTNQDFRQQARELATAFGVEINNAPYNYSTFILGTNNADLGELANVQYAYHGRIRIHTTRQENRITVKLTLRPGWHINSNQPLQQGLIATKINNLDTKNWAVKSVKYPKGTLTNLGFSKEQLSVYENQASIALNLVQTPKGNTPPALSLTLQACSDKVCLPPTTLTLSP